VASGILKLDLQSERAAKSEPEAANSPNKESGVFLFKKAVFLLTSSVGMTMADTLVKNAIAQIGSTPEKLVKEDFKALSAKLESPLSEFVGSDKAAKLTSALRVLVGGITGA